MTSTAERLMRVNCYGRFAMPLHLLLSSLELYTQMIFPLLLAPIGRHSGVHYEKS
ncbi:hypothetical protein [Marinomonas posidonica]|uniref:hypothetical protein n=1 Tax=Marinomonas posidonica TaxID=936476 RepID=UPI00373648DB